VPGAKNGIVLVSATVKPAKAAAPAPKAAAASVPAAKGKK
jgi:hypothetical protein